MTRQSSASRITASPTALEQSFADLCTANDVDTISVQFSVRGLSKWFTSYVHTGGMCASGTADTLAKAIGDAIISLNEKRAMPPVNTLADEALPETEAA